MDQIKAVILRLSKLSTFLNHNISMDSEGPLNSASERNPHFYVIIDQLSNYIVTVPTPESDTQYSANSIIHH